MNILEHWLKEVHIEEDLGDGYVYVEFTIDCYGSIERKKKEMPKRDWEALKKRGYYMG